MKLHAGIGLTIAVLLCITPMASAGYIVESRTGGQNFSKYAESGVALTTSTGKSTAPGATAGIGSRFLSSAYTYKGAQHALFNADLDNGWYDVSTTWSDSANRNVGNSSYKVKHQGVVTEVLVDQRATANAWVTLGIYRFDAGTNAGQVDLNNLNQTTTSGAIYADAVKWEPMTPGKVTAPVPAHETWPIDVNADLSWTAGVYNAKYDVYLAKGNDPLTKIASGIDKTTFDPGTLAMNAKYFWRVDAWNGGVVTTGDLWNFSTPEPTTLALLAVGGLLMRRRRM